MKHRKSKPVHDPRLSRSIQPDDGADPKYDVRGYHNNRELHQAIVERAGAIRTSVAESIQRRKAPTLTYRVIRQS